MLAWRDVTELREAQQARREVEAQLAAAFDAAPVAMAVLDGEVVQRENRALRRLTGPEGAVGRRFGDRFAVGSRRQAQERLEALRAGHPGPGWEARVQPRRGDSRWTEVSLAPVSPGQPGRPGQVVAHLVDVEERKAYESRLRQIADHDPRAGPPARSAWRSSTTRPTPRSAPSWPPI